MAKAKHISDRAAKGLRNQIDGSDGQNLPGPSPNPMTNALIHELVLRSVGRLSRQTVQKAILGKQYGTQFAKDAIENRSIMHSIAAYGVTKVATRSIPGAFLVGGGLLAKTLYDRAQGKKTARRTGKKQLAKQADEDSLL